MPTIQRRRNKWNVQIWRVGAPSISKTLTLKSDAVKWAKATEAAIDRGEVTAAQNDNISTLSDLLIKYRDDIIPKKISREIETYIINLFLRSDLVSMKLTALKSYHFASYRDRRLKDLTGSTVARELMLLHHAFRMAISDLPDPCRASWR